MKQFEQFLSLAIKFNRIEGVQRDWKCFRDYSWYVAVKHGFEEEIPTFRDLESDEWCLQFTKHLAANTQIWNNFSQMVNFRHVKKLSIDDIILEFPNDADLERAIDAVEQDCQKKYDAKIAQEKKKVLSELDSKYLSKKGITLKKSVQLNEITQSSSTCTKLSENVAIEHIIDKKETIESSVATNDIDNNAKVFKCVVCDIACDWFCNGCRTVHYCSKEHQQKDWKNHKSNCVCD